MSSFERFKASPRDVVIFFMFILVLLLVIASQNLCNQNKQSQHPVKQNTMTQQNDDTGNEKPFILVNDNEKLQAAPKIEHNDISNVFQNKVKRVINEKQNATDISSSFKRIKKIVNEKQTAETAYTVYLRYPFSTFIQPKSRSEREQAIEGGDGSVFEGWGGGHQVKDGLAENVWQENKAWDKKKQQVADAMFNICGMFNNLLLKKVFPSGLKMQQTNDTFKVIDNASGRCVSLEKWISFVNGSIAAQMGYTPGTKTLLAKFVPLGFDTLDQVVSQLAPLLTDDETCATYKSNDKNKITDTQDQELSYEITWPVDGSNLLKYPLKI